MIFTVLSAILLTATPLVVPKIPFPQSIPRSGWLSFSSGISVAYVFVHLLPELARHQAEIGDEVEFLSHEVYLASLVGLAIFYGLESMALQSRRARQASGGEDVAERRIFVLNMIAYAFYNAVVAEALVGEPRQDGPSQLLFAVALAVHLLVTDYGLREHHKSDYDRVGRYVLAASFLIGLVLAMAVELPGEVIAITTAILVGGIVLNTLKEELPAERQSSFGAFAAGLSSYTILLLVL